MSQAEYVQKRFRIPKALYDEMEADAIAYGSNVQRELVSRLLRGSRKAGQGAMNTGIAVGEIDVAEKLNESLSAVLANMKRTALATQALAADPPELDEMLDDDESES